MSHNTHIRASNKLFFLLLRSQEQIASLHRYDSNIQSKQQITFSSNPKQEQSRL